MISALEALWQRLQAEVPDLPPILPTISPTQSRWDHGPERWGTDDKGSITGLVVTADVLQAGPEAVVAHMLHEAAHVLNWQRGAKDTTARGAYHNQTFLAAAEEVGLTWPAGAGRSRTRGYDTSVLSDAALRRHAKDVEHLASVIDLVLPHMELPTQSRSKPDRLTYRCECKPARTFRISMTVASKGSINCGVCGKEFKEG
ncbi:hypothetical protein ABZ352_35455 [Streptomyces griseofuscus]|uniref:hypothetical protein n=1 Tax=Streptomyces griseofuscus TaxID=146922 RepID=UPI0033FD5937